MPIKLVRRPRSATRMTADVRSEVRKGLQTLATVVQARLENDVKTWNNKPEFKVTVTLTNSVWSLSAKVNKRNKSGKIYTWIDEGVGEYGGKTKLPDIVVKNKKKFMGFTVPHQPKSLPNPPVAGIPSSETPHGVRVKIVRHPGIYPRNFTLELKKWLVSKQPGAFRSTIEAAVKRALRKR